MAFSPSRIVRYIDKRTLCRFLEMVKEKFIKLSKKNINFHKNSECHNQTNKTNNTSIKEELSKKYQFHCMSSRIFFFKQLWSTGNQTDRQILASRILVGLTKNLKIYIHFLFYPIRFHNLSSSTSSHQCARSNQNWCLPFTRFIWNVVYAEAFMQGSIPWIQRNISPLSASSVRFA